MCLKTGQTGPYHQFKLNTICPKWFPILPGLQNQPRPQLITLSHSYSILSPLSYSCILLTLTNAVPPPAKTPKRKMWLYQRADFKSANDSLTNFSLDESSHQSTRPGMTGIHILCLLCLTPSPQDL